MKRRTEQNILKLIASKRQLQEIKDKLGLTLLDKWTDKLELEYLVLNVKIDRVDRAIQRVVETEEL